MDVPKFHFNFLRLRETHNVLQLTVFFFSFLLFFCQPRKIILQTMEKLMQYMVLELYFRSLKYKAVIRQKFEQLSIPIQAIQGGDYSVLM